MEMKTPWSTNAVEITKNIGINNISRIEILKLGSDNYDSMTEFSYNNPDKNIFDLKNSPEKVKYIENIYQYLLIFLTQTLAAMPRAVYKAQPLIILFIKGKYIKWPRNGHYP